MRAVAAAVHAAPGAGTQPALGRAADRHPAAVGNKKKNGKNCNNGGWSTKKKRKKSAAMAVGERFFCRLCHRITNRYEQRKNVKNCNSGGG